MVSSFVGCIVELWIELHCIWFAWLSGVVCLLLPSFPCSPFLPSLFPLLFFFVFFLSLPFLFPFLSFFFFLFLFLFPSLVLFSLPFSFSLSLSLFPFSCPPCLLFLFPSACLALPFLLPSLFSSFSFSLPVLLAALSSFSCPSSAPPSCPSFLLFFSCFSFSCFSLVLLGFSLHWVLFHPCLLAVSISSLREPFGLTASMERSRSSRRSVSIDSHQESRALLPIPNSPPIDSPCSSRHFVEGLGLAGVIPPPPPPTTTWDRCMPSIPTGE